jgi:uncharacterized protein (TIGR02246 family)
MHTQSQKDETWSGEPLKNIQNLIAMLSIAWNTLDAAKYASAFAEDADFVTPLIS